MTSLMHEIRRFLRDEEGATAVEYGLMVALIAAIIAVIVAALGVEVQGAFETVCKAIDSTAACDVTAGGG